MEAKILIRIVRLNITKICNYVKDLHVVKNIFEEPISTVGLYITKVFNSPTGLQPFLEWFRYIYMIKDLPLDPVPKVLLYYIE